MMVKGFLKTLEFNIHAYKIKHEYDLRKTIEFCDCSNMITKPLLLDELYSDHNHFYYIEAFMHLIKKELKQIAHQYHKVLRSKQVKQQILDCIDNQYLGCLVEAEVWRLRDRTLHEHGSVGAWNRTYSQPFTGTLLRMDLDKISQEFHEEELLQAQEFIVRVISDWKTMKAAHWRIPTYLIYPTVRRLTKQYFMENHNDYHAI